MKKIFISLFAITSISVSAQIPNNSFENWTTVSTYSNPTSWDQLNAMTSSMSIYTATKGTGGATGGGASYLKLISKTVGTMGVVPGVAVSGVLDMTTFKAKSGFAFAQQPQKLTGNWQYMAYGADAGFVAVYLTKWNSMMMVRDTVAKAMQNLSGMVMSWANFNLNLTYMSSAIPDSAIIILSSSGAIPVNNSYLYVDNLSFSGAVTGLKSSENIISNISVFPIPTTENITVQLNVQKTSVVKIQLIDVTGKLIKETNVGEIIGKFETTINTVGIKEGTYFLKVISKDAVEIKKIIIQ